VLLAVVVALLPSRAFAQASGNGFLFKQPTVQVGVQGGYTLARAGGRVLRVQRKDLTLDKRDFDAPSWGLQVAVRANERFDIAFDVRFARSEVGSEMRDWVDQDFLPIEQTTEFVRVPVTLSAKYYLRERGRAIGEFAWIPETWSPFIGAGAGLAWYRFKQDGDFKDALSNDILRLTLESSGGTPIGHVLGGVDISIGPRFLWSFEGRYGLGNADTDATYGNERIDLSGFQGTIGLAIRF